jgi:hypothetical protein
MIFDGAIMGLRPTQRNENGESASGGRMKCAHHISGGLAQRGSAGSTIREKRNKSRRDGTACSPVRQCRVG